jgi:glycosyltransferase involved in cell wall biosynthesis
MQHVGCPLVTVITPAYNSAQILETVESVLSQAYPNIEYIITDDGSDMFPKAEIKRLKNYEHIKDFKIIEHECNIGTVKNINGALKVSRGEYVFFLSGDDVFEDEEVISEWVDKFEKTGAMIITAYRKVYDCDLQKLIYIAPKKSQVRKIKRLTPSELYQDLCTENYILGSVTARSRKCIEKYGYFDERYKLIEDYPMNLYLLRQGEKIVFWDRCAVKCRGSGISVAENNNETYNSDLELLFSLEQFAYSENAELVKSSYEKWKRKRDRRAVYFNIMRTDKLSCLKKSTVIIKYLDIFIKESIKKFRIMLLYRK